MSPEQAKGRPVDRRTDIWAFGCVLFKLPTGKTPFGGDSFTDILAAVVRDEPDWAQLPVHTSQRIHSLLQRCLEKDARQRLQSIGEARLALEKYLANPGLASSELSGIAEGVGSADSSKRRALWWALGAFAVGAALTASMFEVLHSAHTANEVRAIRAEIKPSVSQATSIFKIEPGTALRLYGFKRENFLDIVSTCCHDSALTASSPCDVRYGPPGQGISPPCFVETIAIESEALEDLN